MSDPPNLPYRITTPLGYRRYLCSGLYIPSVTTILSATESDKSKATLKNWQERNPGGLEAAAARGTAIHLCCEQHLRGLPIDCPPDYAAFWNGMSQYLDWFDVLHWSERPLRPDWTHLRSDDKVVSYVWSLEHQFAGCPDLVGEIGGVRVIADFKTSNAPYRTSFPKSGDRGGYGGWRKFTKTAQQLAAYRLALAERTGYRPEVGLIIVTTEETTQAIFIDSDQMDMHEARFIKRCQQFHALEEVNIETENLGQQELHQQEQSV